MIKIYSSSIVREIVEEVADDFSNSKNFDKCLDFSGGQKNFFLQKCPKSGLVSFKKYVVFFITLALANVTCRNI